MGNIVITNRMIRILGIFITVLLTLGCSMLGLLAGSIDLRVAVFGAYVVSLLYATVSAIFLLAGGTWFHWACMVIGGALFTVTAGISSQLGEIAEHGTSLLQVAALGLSFLIALVINVIVSFLSYQMQKWIWKRFAIGTS